MCDADGVCNPSYPHRPKTHSCTYVTTADDLRPLFEKYGDVGDIFIPSDPFTKKSKGFAFVRYVKEDDMKDALTGMDGHELDGRELRIQACVALPSAAFHAVCCHALPADTLGTRYTHTARLPLDTRCCRGMFHISKVAMQRKKPRGEERGRYDDRRYDDRGRNGYDDRRGGGFDPRRDRRDGGGGYDRRGGYDDDRRGGYERRRSPPRERRRERSRSPRRERSRSPRHERRRSKSRDGGRDEEKRSD